jgi:uncharacterized cupin superfamily protein
VAFFRQPRQPATPALREKTMSKISLLDYPSTPHEAYEVDAAKMIGGSPKQILSNHYSNPSGEFHLGFWEAEVGEWNVNYTEYEYCEILQGRILMRDRQGVEQIVAAGDRFVIEAGYQGVWKVLEPAKKVYVIFEPKKS